MIELSHVKKSYRKNRVLEDISFSIRPNEITCLIGVNGTGKTTIMNAIMRLIPIDGGEITLDGRPISYDDFNRIAYVPDAIVADYNLTVRESLDYMATYYNSYKEDRARDLMNFFRLDPDSRISELSKGNVSKVNLLMNLALDVDYILMDEPFSGIDVFTREEITQVFTDDLIQGRGLLISTHEINDIELLIDRAIFIDEGRVIRDFYPEEVREETGKNIVDLMREVYLND